MLPRENPGEAEFRAKVADREFEEGGERVKKWDTNVLSLCPSPYLIQGTQSTEALLVPSLMEDTRFQRLQLCSLISKLNSSHSSVFTSCR